MKTRFMGMIMAVTAGGMLVVAAGSAQAATNCAVGSWKTTRYVGEISSDLSTPISGRKGTKVKISKTAIVWNFNGSTDEVIGSWDDDVPPITTTYRKTLKMKVRLTGTKKGAIKAKPSSATGNATFSVHAPGALPKASLVKSVRAGIQRTLYGGSYICKVNNLKISGRHTYSDGEYDAWTWWLRRAR